MLIKKPNKIKSFEISSERNYINRRNFIKSGCLIGGGIISDNILTAELPSQPFEILKNIKESQYSTDEQINNIIDVTSYNNYYEFGLGKDDPNLNSRDFKSRPWTVEVEGEAEKTGIFDIEDFIRPYQLEERIYRMRCVEAWSMVIPWVGFPLSKLLNEVQPTGNARFVEFVSLYDTEQMPGQKSPVLDWPYTEGLRIDEAMNPLTLLTVGLYGEILPNQNGAPVRIIVPWKYGFKSAKSIVTIRLTEKQPNSSWNLANPSEYGFYSNVNPNVSHPRWSQRRERRIGEFLKRDTLMFNGYSEWVADLYRDLDLTEYF